MLKDILKAFQSPEPEKFTHDDAFLALAALMVRLARTDGAYSEAEITMIDQALVKHFTLSPEESQTLRKDAEALEAEAPDTVRFTRTIKSAVAYEDRAGVVETLWSVVLADGTRDHEEDGLMRLVANLLGVNDRDSAFARQRAQNAARKNA